jgi:hypothetical protein
LRIAGGAQAEKFAETEGRRVGKGSVEGGRRNAGRVRGADFGKLSPGGAGDWGVRQAFCTGQLKPGAYLRVSRGNVRRCSKLPPGVLRIYDTMEGRTLWVSAQWERAPVKIFHRRGAGLGCQRTGERVAGWE